MSSLSLPLFPMHTHTHTQRKPRNGWCSTSPDLKDTPAPGRENVPVGSLTCDSPCCSVCGVSQSHMEQDCTSRTPFPQDTSEWVLATRVHQTVKFSILALKISCCFTCKVLNVCLGSDCRCHHWRGWDLFFNFQTRWINSFPTKVSQAVFVSRTESLG